MTRSIVQVVLCLSLLLAGSAEAQTFNRVVAFGDSLSDAGNYFAATGEQAHKPYDPVATAPYPMGGPTFSNGATWVEHLTQDLGLATDGQAAFRVPWLFTNYAVGRSRARSDSPVFSRFNLTTQVDAFLSDFEGAAPSDALYVIWIGSNDLFEAIDAYSGDTSGATSGAIVAAAITATSNAIVRLWYAGARTVFVANLPDAGITPVLTSQGAPAVQLGTWLSMNYNAALAEALESLEDELHGLTIIAFDVYTLLNEVAADPANAGLADAETPCVSFDVVGQAHCARPQEFLFWDAIHPTKSAHRFLATKALEALNGM